MRLAEPGGRDRRSRGSGVPGRDAVEDRSRREPASPPHSATSAIHVPDSQANFVWATGGAPARETFQQLKERRILVRLMSYPGYPEGLRISVGTDDEIDRLLDAMHEVL